MRSSSDRAPRPTGTRYTSTPASGKAATSVPSASSAETGVGTGPAALLTDRLLRVRTAIRSSLCSRSKPGSFLVP